MISTTARPRASRVIADLAARGRYHFTADEMRTTLGVSETATRLALSRLAKKRLVASPARGFYVILLPEYRRLGCLPAGQFVPTLMEHSERPYYAALLSAAEYHGAAHHHPQVFQVALAGARRAIFCGRVKVSFFVRKRLAEVPVQSLNTPRGTLLVSSPEATAIDLVGYEKRIGGMDMVATILSELAEEIDPDLLVGAARTAPVPWAQRLGYLLDLAGAADKTVPLKAYVRRHTRGTVSLLPDFPDDRDTPRSKDWRLRINAEVDIEV